MEMTIDQALQKGIEAHKASQIQEADRFYTAILKAQPKHPDANHNMGVLAVGVGKFQEALPFLKTALEANPNPAQFWLSYIDALIKLERLVDAKAVFDQAKSKGAKGDGFDQLEQRLKASDKVLTEAVTESQVVEPDQPDILDTLKLDPAIKLAKKKSKEGYTEEAKRVYQDTLVRLPKNKGAIDGMKALAGGPVGKSSKVQDPPQDQLQSLINLYSQGQLSTVVEHAQVLVKQYPEASAIWNLMGVSAAQIGKLDHAILAFQRILAIKPDNAGAHNNMGNVLKEQGKLEEAIVAYNKALTIKPDYARAYNNASVLLKTYSPNTPKNHVLFVADKKIKKISNKLIISESNDEIADILLKGLSYISEDGYCYKTPLSQIYKRNSKDLNCKRHKQIFETKNIIPEFCFGCFKVQVEADTFFDLIRLTGLFYNFELKENLITKTMIELRPEIPGFYKGLIFCRGLDQARKVKNLLDTNLKVKFHNETFSKIKRGCSEFPLKFPEYGKIENDINVEMDYPIKWEEIEIQFDQNNSIQQENMLQSISGFCLSDFYIIQKWIDYAKGLGDTSSDIFSDKPIIFPEIYNAAKLRREKFDKAL